ncbi:MAG: hypothetical protein GX220_03570 [Treponema sp.]|nr:hypothetical protein [Treponema sp.]
MKFPKISIIVVCFLAIVFISCGSKVSEQPSKETSAQAAQRARETADDAFLKTFGSSVGVSSKDSSSKKEAEKSTPVEEKPVMKIGQEPSWVKQPQTGADQNLFLCGTGEGKTSAEAENNAIASLARIIRQDISSQTTTTDSVTVKNDITTSSSSSLDEIVKTESLIKDLVGVRIKEFYTNKLGRIHALAVMNRAEASEIYVKKIADTEQTVLDLIADSEKQSKTFEGYFAIRKAAALANQIEDYASILAVVDKQVFQAYKPIYGSKQAVDKKAFEFATSLAIGVNIKGDYNGRAAAAVSKVLGDYGFFTTSTKAKYLIEGNLAFDNASVGKNIFVRYTFDSYLKDVENGTRFFPFSSNAREGHLTEAEAKNRSVRTMEKNIETKFAQAFNDFVAAQ